MSSLLVVGAHAMDAEIMAGGLAAAAVDGGWDVQLLHLTRGERGHPELSATIFGPQLEREMAEAAGALGVGYEWAGIMAPLPEAGEVAPVIRDAIERVHVDVVVTHWKGSWHQSHVRAHEAVVLAAGIMEAAPPVLYAENCEDLTGFSPTHFASMDHVMAKWLQAMEAYELFRLSKPDSYSGGIPYWCYYVAAMRVRGMQCGFELAEAFMPAGEGVPDSLGLRHVRTLGRMRSLTCRP
jgi:LmbE family N-acetylglucosaminyl deacetylase